MNALQEQQMMTTMIKKSLHKIEELQAKLDELQAAQREPIAIVGLSCRFPGAETPAAFWQLLQDGVDAIAEIPKSRWNIDDYYDPTPVTPGKVYTRYGGFLDQVDTFDPEFFRISAREATNLDPQQRLLLETSWEALESAALTGDGPPTRTGVFVGISDTDYRDLIVRNGGEIDAYFGSGNTHSTASGRLSHYLGLTGPNLAVDTACSSSLVAVALAVKSLRQQECDVALAGGVQTQLAPDNQITASQAHMLSPDGRCKSFDAAADGYVRAEGCGMVVLKRLSNAIADGDQILAVIRGAAINHDGHTSGLTVPSGPAQQAVIRQALADGAVKPEQVSYIEAHGTGTALGDPIEMGALQAVFGQRTHPLLVGSVKTNIGHAEAAAGIAGLIKIVLSMQHGAIPRNLHFNQPSPHIVWDQWPVQVPTEQLIWQEQSAEDESLFAGVSSFGFSGTNCHVVLASAPRQPQRLEQEAKTDRTHHLLTLSARTPKALQELAQRYATALTVEASEPTVEGEPSLADICFTANSGRRAFQYRHAVTAATKATLYEQLQSFAHAGLEPQQIATQTNHSRPQVAFLFTGQGSQYVGMGHALYATQPIFRAALDRCDALYQAETGESLLAVLYPETGETRDETRDTEQAGEFGVRSKLDDTTYTQPALFALEYALATLWQAWGIQPAILIGHSVGELVAACIAGVFSLEDGLKLVAARGRLMGALPQDGAMVSCLADEQRVRAAIAPFPQELAIAAVNGPESVVIAGKRQAVQAVVAQLAGAGIKTRPLTVSHAFHSPLMAPMLDDFRRVAATITYHPPKLPVVSNLTGKIAGDELLSPDYWVRHVRESVRFAEGVTTLHEQGINIFLEIGPGTTLLGLAEQTLEQMTERQADKMMAETDDAKHESSHHPVILSSCHPVMLPSLRKNQPDWQQMLTSMGELYGRGVAINWPAFDQPYTRRKVVLPTYPFQRQRYWLETATVAPPPPPTPPLTQSSATPLLQAIQQGDGQGVLALLQAGGNLSALEQQALPAIVERLLTQQRQQATQAAIQDWLYEVKWQAGSSTEAEIAGTLPQEWLIFADVSGLGARLADHLRQQGANAILLYPGDRYAPLTAQQLQIRPDQAEDYQQALTHLPVQGGVIYLWGLDTPTADPAIDPLQVTAHGCNTALHLVQALVQHQPPITGLWLVTQDAQAVQQTDRLTGILQSPLWGMGKVIDLEHPELHCVQIDLDGALPLAQQTDLLAAELRIPLPAQPRETQVALRNGLRYVARLTRYQPQPTTSSSVQIRPDATYLITGGLGGLGLVVARWLVEQGARHLVLMGRSQPKAAVAEQLQTIAAMGATITVAQADVSQRTQVADALAQLDPSYPLAGIIHAAGLLEDGILLQQTKSRFQQVLAPKVAGAWHLHTLTAEVKLDFFLLFSSMASLLGSHGQANYAAANAFLDGFAAYRRSQHLPAASFAWDAWSEVGLAARLEQKLFQQSYMSQDQMLTPLQGIAAFAQLLTQDGVQVGISRMDWRQFFQHQPNPVPFFAHFAQPFCQQALIPSGDQDALRTPALTVSWRNRLLEMPSAERPQHLTHYFCTQIAHILRLPNAEAVPVTANLLTLGFDSLMGIELRNHIKQVLGINLPLARFVAGISVDELIQGLLPIYDQAASEAAHRLSQVPELADSSPQTIIAEEPTGEKSTGEESWVSITI